MAGRFSLIMSILLAIGAVVAHLQITEIIATFSITFCVCILFACAISESTISKT